MLETRAATMRFGGVTAVDKVDFQLAEVELRCLIGPNGAGKSTFFKMLTGQLTATEGTILFRGTDITKANTHEIARLGVGIKTQVPNVFNGLTVRQNVESPPAARSRAAAPARSLTKPWSACSLRPSRNAPSASLPTASANGWKSPPCLPRNPNSFCWTSPPPA